MRATAKAEMREQWLQGALKATKGAELVCLDPDNGVAPDRKGMYGQDGPKHAYMSDLRDFWERGQSLVVYHHLGRRGTAVEQVRKIASQLRDGLDTEPIPLLFHRGSARVFLVLVHPDHKKAITERVGSLVAGPWGRHFEPVTL